MNSYVKSILIVASLLLIITVSLWGLGDALGPLVFSFGLAYLVFPLIKKMEKKGVGRNKAVLCVLLAFLVVGGSIAAFVVPRVVNDAIAFSKELPSLTSNAIEKIETLSEGWGYSLDLSKDNIHAYLQANFDGLKTQVRKNAAGWVTGLFSGIANWLVGILNLFLIPLFFFYVINDFEKITTEMKSFIPPSSLPRIKHYMNLSNSVLSGYIRGQLMVALTLGGLYAFGLSVIGLKFGFLIGLFSGLLSIIPYAGFTLGFLAALIVGLANFYGMGLIIGIVIVFSIVQALEGVVITPKFVGDKVGLSSLATMLALIIGGNLLGLPGMILGIPVAAIMKSVLGDLKKEYRQIIS